MIAPRTLFATFAALALAGGMAACGTTGTSAGFSGEKHNVAQAVANLANDATSLDQEKVCKDDLAASVKASLNRYGGCQAALKTQLRQIDEFTLTVEEVTISGKKATARVKSTHSGKERLSTLLLVKEGGSWKVAGVA